MKQHFCPAEKSTITYQDKCNWCGELESQEPVALPCCGYTDASAVKWNPLNGVVQCHNCGQNYTTPPQRTEQEPKDWKTPLKEDAPLVKWAKEQTAPQRTWVGLTDEEIELYWDWEDFQCGCGRSTLFAMVRDIEARLKDRNI